MGYSEAIEVRGDQKVLYCAGTTALDENGDLPTALDIRSQISATLDNLERVLGTAGHGFADLVRITVYSCAMDDVLQNLDALVARIADKRLPARRYAYRRHQSCLPGTADRD